MDKKYSVGLDIGTTKIVAMVGEKNQFNKVKVLGVGKSQSLGVHRGVVNNITQTIQSIKIAVDEAQNKSNIEILEVAFEKGIEFNDPIIIAETGWKTFDLLYEINRTKFSLEYDYISLLIGVNNQFNSRPIKEFEEDLVKLLDKMKKIIKDEGSIIIISIPDWGYTPFGESYNRESISNEIDRFNNSLKKFANINDLKFVDVTDISRRAIYQSDLITKDNLHPSGLMYFLWAQRIYNTWID